MRLVRTFGYLLCVGLLAGCTKAAPPVAPSPAAGDKESPVTQPSSKEAAAGAERPQAIPAPADVAAPPAGAAKSASGVSWVVLSPGAGDEPAGSAGTVSIHYSGWTRDGRLFDSSLARGAPTTLPLEHVIPGFREGVASMTTGEKRRIWIPAQLAYGDAPEQAGAPAGQLTFDIEVLEILRPPSVPEDVAAPGASATVLPSGLAYRVLRPGTSAERPSATSLITVHYTGWTADGRMFDSSVQRGEPFQFRPEQVIPGWGEGVRLMTVGSVYRFWIPSQLAYGDPPVRPGAPAGQLTFDVELLGVE
jgi:FKBP-type peptidyl-prolyl cis-trans isomerase